MWKQLAIEGWCDKMSRTAYGRWRPLYVPQQSFQAALGYGIQSFAQLVQLLGVS